MRATGVLLVALTALIAAGSASPAGAARSGVGVGAGSGKLSAPAASLPLCPGTGTIVCLRPGAQTVPIGESVTVSLSVSNASNLGAFQATLSFDPAILTFVSSTSGPFLAGSGRALLCQPTPALGQLDVFCITLGPTPAQGVSGEGDLLFVTFQGLGGGTSALALSNVELADPSGVPQPSTTAGASITVNAATPTPCAGPCPTSTPTLTATATTLPAGTMLVGLNPQSASGTIGQEVTVDVVASNASNVAAFSFEVRFAASVASSASVAPGPFLGSTGRTVFCTPPTIRSGVLDFGCASQGSTIAGASGSGILASVRFIILGQGSSSLTLTAQATDPQGEPLALFVTGGTLSGIAGPAATPTPCNGPCPSPTSAATLTPTPTPVAFPATCASSVTVVCVQPVTQTAAVGSSIDIGVVVGNVADLGAFQFTVTVDPTILTPVGASAGYFLGGSGRTVLCASVTVGPSSVQFSCGSLGSEPPAGPSGSGVVATAQFLVAGGGSSSVALSDTIITSPQGSIIPAITQNGAVSAIALTPTPCAGPCPTVTSAPPPTSTPIPPAVSCPGAAVAAMCLNPSTQVVTAGSPFTVEIVADRANNVGSYEFQLVFDGVLLTANGAVDGGFLGSSGRTVLCPAPIFGPGTITFACASIGASPPGPSAPGLLGIVTFTPNVAGTSTLHFGRATLTDPLANPIRVTALDGSVVIQ